MGSIINVSGIFVTIHPPSTHPNTPQPFLRPLCFMSPQFVSELGWVLYSALDYGLGCSEERELGPALHTLIYQMTNAGEWWWCYQQCSVAMLRVTFCNSVYVSVSTVMWCCYVARYFHQY